MVHNPYRAVIVRARQESTTPLDEISTALDAVKLAMDGGAG